MTVKESFSNIVSCTPRLNSLLAGRMNITMHNQQSETQESLYDIL